MRLRLLSIKNFKGVTSFALRTKEAGNANIHGDNATGKTTIVDAVYWLLFDKDSQWKKIFEIKPLDAQGQEIHNLETAVEAEFILSDETTLTLKKVYKEKYTRKRGAVEAEFTGHTTDYAIDGVPSKKKEFTAKVAEFANEEFFKLLTSPAYFNEQMHWKDRRQMLLDVCGDVSEADVIASNPALAALPEILAKKSVEDCRKITMAMRKEINEELLQIPAKIEGANAVLPEPMTVRLDIIIDKITKLQAQADEKRQELAKINAGGMIAEKEKQVAQIETEIARLEIAFSKAAIEQVKDLNQQLDDVNVEKQKLDTAVQKKLAQIETAKSEIESLTERNKKLAAEYDQRAALHFDEQSCTCPTCKQALPADQVESSKKRFNTERAATLEKINTEGVANKEKIDLLNSQINQEQKSIAQDQEAQLSLTKQVEAQVAEIDKLRAEVPQLKDSQEYRSLTNRKNDLLGEISQVRNGHQDLVDKIHAKIATIKGQIKEQQALADQIEARAKGEQAIKKYEAREKELAQQFEHCEYRLSLLDLFVKTKVSMLEESISSQFTMAQFKLFEEQINGGLAECCETTYNGVPYGSMNSARKIQVGMDIIDTLSRHYGFYPFIFIDNAEGITQLPEMKAQAIALYVSEADKELRVI